MTIAVCARTLQFRAGPNEYTFHACDEHRAVLASNDPEPLFFMTTDQPLREVAPDDELQCDWCREG